MKFSILLSIILTLLCSCSNSKFDSSAKTAKIVTFEYQCSDSKTSSEFISTLKSKIDRWKGEATIQGIAMMKNPRQFNLHIAEVVDENAFLEYLQTPMRIKFMETYSIDELPDIAKFIADSSTFRDTGNLLKMGAVFMYGTISDTAAISQLLNKEKRLFPKDIIWKWGKMSDIPSSNNMFPLYSLKSKVLIENVNVNKVNAEISDYTGEPQLMLYLTDKGAQILGDMTTKAYNNNSKHIAIILNDVIISVPKVMSPILNGQASLIGGFTKEKVEELAGNFQDGLLNYCHLKIVSIKNTN